MEKITNAPSQQRAPRALPMLVNVVFATLVVTMALTVLSGIAALAVESPAAVMFAHLTTSLIYVYLGVIFVFEVASRDKTVPPNLWRQAVARPWISVPMGSLALGHIVLGFVGQPTNYWGFFIPEAVVLTLTLVVGMMQVASWRR